MHEKSYCALELSHTHTHTHTHICTRVHTPLSYRDCQCMKLLASDAPGTTLVENVLSKAMPETPQETRGCLHSSESSLLFYYPSLPYFMKLANLP